VVAPAMQIAAESGALIVGHDHTVSACRATSLSDLSEIYMRVLVHTAGYEDSDLSNGHVQTLTRWWSPEGEYKLTNEPALGRVALDEIIGVFDAAPSGRPFRFFIDLLHTRTVPAIGLTPALVTRAATLWTQGRWNPGANANMVIGVGTRRGFEPQMEALGKLGLKYQYSRQSVF
jgi:hypothetical protein